MSTHAIKPPQLKTGDAVGIVSPSWGGPAVFPHRLEAGMRQSSCLDIKWSLQRMLATRTASFLTALKTGQLIFMPCLQIQRSKPSLPQLAVTTPVIYFRSWILI
jgi:hypothetical protein